MKKFSHINIYNLSQLKSFGKDVFISKNVEIKRPELISTGNHICIDSGFYITTKARLGDYIHIGPYVCVIGGINGLLKMGNFTNIAAGSRIICGSDEFLGKGFSFPGLTGKYRDKLIIDPIVMEDFVGVGASVTILPGIKLGTGSVVGAGSVVTKNTEPWTIYAGNPAKPIKKRTKYKMLKLAIELGYDC
jgi:acetyltransferase-like isoleucine patch superfamily enzyme